MPGFDLEIIPVKKPASSLRKIKGDKAQCRNLGVNGSGGGIYNFGGNDGTPNVTAIVRVTGTTFSANSASSHGGAIYNDRSALGQSSASAIVRNTFFKMERQAKTFTTPTEQLRRSDTI